MKILLFNKSLSIKGIHWEFKQETDANELEDFELELLYYTNYWNLQNKLMYFFVFKYTLTYRNTTFSVYLFCH